MFLARLKPFRSVGGWPLGWAGGRVLTRDTHVPPQRPQNVCRGPRLGADKTVAKMGHPEFRGVGGIWLDE